MSHDQSHGLRLGDHTDTMRPTAALYETYTRWPAPQGSQSILTSGREVYSAIALPAGITVANITFYSGSTPASGTINNIWFALRDSSKALLGITSDDAGSGWTANTKKTLALATPYAVTASGLYYITIMVSATVPTIAGIAVSQTTIAEPPILSGSDSTHTGLTNTASAPPTGALSANISGAAYGWVS